MRRMEAFGPHARGGSAAMAEGGVATRRELATPPDAKPHAGPCGDIGDGRCMRCECPRCIRCDGPREDDTPSLYCWGCEERIEHEREVERTTNPLDYGHECDPEPYLRWRGPYRW